MKGIQPGGLSPVSTKNKSMIKKRRTIVGMPQKPIQKAKNKALQLDADNITEILDSLNQGGLPQKFNWKQYTKSKYTNSQEDDRICLWPIVWTVLYELSHDTEKTPDDKNNSFKTY